MKNTRKKMVVIIKQVVNSRNCNDIFLTTEIRSITSQKTHTKSNIYKAHMKEKQNKIIIIIMVYLNDFTQHDIFEL